MKASDLFKLLNQGMHLNVIFIHLCHVNNELYDYPLIHKFVYPPLYKMIKTYL